MKMTNKKQICYCTKKKCILIDGEWCRTNFFYRDFERCPFPKARDKEIKRILKEEANRNEQT